jgi:hypothetical protein
VRIRLHPGGAVGFHALPEPRETAYAVNPQGKETKHRTIHGAGQTFLVELRTSMQLLRPGNASKFRGQPWAICLGYIALVNVITKNKGDAGKETRQA